MAEAVRLHITSDHVVPMPEVDNRRPRPTEVRYFRLSVEDVGGVIFVKFDKACIYNLGVGEDIKTALAPVVDGHEPPTGWKDVAEHQPGRTAVSIECAAHCYLVLVIGKGDCQYAESVASFKVQQFKDKYYFETRCAWRAANGTLQIKKKADSSIHSKVAYFIARCDEDSASAPQSYVTAFNIYVDVLDSNGNILRPAQAVDPDVGYPGGNTVGP